jgi:hypothetical protein
MPSLFLFKVAVVINLPFNSLLVVWVNERFWTRNSQDGLAIMVLLQSSWTWISCLLVLSVARMTIHTWRVKLMLLWFVLMRQFNNNNRCTNCWGFAGGFLFILGKCWLLRCWDLGNAGRLCSVPTSSFDKSGRPPFGKHGTAILLHKVPKCFALI